VAGITVEPLIEYEKLSAVGEPVHVRVMLVVVTEDVTTGAVGGSGSVITVKGGDDSGGVGVLLTTTIEYVVFGLAPEKAAVLPTVATFME